MQYREFPQDLAPVARLVTGLLVPGAIRRCRRVLTLSAFSRDQILRYVPVDPGRIAVAHLGVASSYAAPQPAAERQARLARLIPGAGRYLLCVANTYPHKNVAALVRAFGRVLHETPCDLVLNGGPGRGEDELQGAWRELGHTGRIRRVSGLAPDDLVALYQAAEGFVFPSLYEGFGLPVLEAMSAGVPVLAVNRAAVPEIGGDCIRYCDGTVAGLADGLRGLLRLADADRRRLVAQARERAAGFTWQRTADATVACLRAAAGNDRARPSS
jgi:glycosyltransferase involved in cell wall biosynthesis